MASQTPNEIAMKEETHTAPSDFPPSPYRDNASLCAPIRVDCHAPAPTRNEQIAQAVITICPNLFQPNHYNLEKLTIRQLGGGLSNYLYVISSEDTRTPSVLVRIHVGEDDDLFVDRSTENKTLAWLSKQQMAPIFYGRFENGRVEEFYEDCFPLRHSDIMSETFCKSIATAIAQLHTLTPPQQICPPPEFLEHGQIWSRIESWFEVAKSMSLQHQDSPKLQSLNVASIMYKEYIQLKQQLTNLPLMPSDHSIKSIALHFSRSIVFTHMDCQSLNILKSPKWNKHQIKLIDFEYSGLNPRAADIANTFCECCDMNNLNANYSTEYPTVPQQTIFLKEYTLHAKPEMAKYLEETRNWDEFLKILRDDVNKFALLSHLVWAVWAVAQAYLSSIEFDYLEYAKHRMEGYWYFQKRFLNLEVEEEGREEEKKLNEKSNL